MSPNRKNIIFYFICICIGATAFQFYSEGLSRLEWTYAGCLFSLSSWLSVLFLHHPTANGLHKIAKLELEKTANDKTWSELTKSEWVTIAILSVLSFIGFAFMLPHLNDQDSAIYFAIIGSALVRFLAIVVAQKLFSDKIGNKLFFWLGFIICIVGIGLYNYKKIENGTWSKTILIASLIWGCMEVITSQAKRFVTIPFKERKVAIPFLSNSFLSIKTQQEKSELLKTVLFGIWMIVHFIQNKFTFSVPTVMETFGIMWIGYSVTVWGGTISQGFKNKIGETIASIFLSLRVISSLALAPLIAIIFFKPHPFEIWTDVFKWAAVVIIFIGSYFSLVKGKPNPEDLKPQID